MRVSRGRAVRDHSDWKIGGVGWCVEYLNVKNGGEAAESLGTDAQPVHLVVEFDAQLFGCGFGTARNQVLNIDRIHQRLFGQEHGFFGGTTDADSEHSGRTPSGTHGWESFQNPINDRVGRVEHHELALGFGSSTLGGYGDFDSVAADKLYIDSGWGGVSSVLTSSRRVGEHGGAKDVVGISVGAANAFIDHSLNVEGGRSSPWAFKADIHAHLHEGIHYARVLTDRAVAFGAHTAVDKDLCHGVFSGV